MEKTERVELVKVVKVANPKSKPQISKPKPKRKYCANIGINLIVKV